MNKSEELRLRKKKIAITEIVREMDSFPKMPDDFKRSSGIGGLFSVATFVIALSFTISEILYYQTSRIYYKFVPDVDFHDKLTITVDMTVAMRCHDIGADIVDVTDQESKLFGKFELEDAWFELSDNQKLYFEEVRRINTYLKEKYHSLRNILWNTGYTNINKMPKRTSAMEKPYDACRISGELELNKVAGNFHITLGKSLSIPGGHIHLQQLFPHTSANFSHRIDKFFFGHPAPTIIHPLDSNIKFSSNNSQYYKYFIEIISTDLDTSKASIKTYQYSVKELSKHDSGDMSGIFFKYDVSPLKVMIREHEYTVWNLIIRLSLGITGIYIISNFLVNVIELTIKYKYGDAYISGQMINNDN